MIQKPTHLHFTDEDLSDPGVKKAYDKAEKKAEKAEKAVDKVTPQKPHSKLRDETESATARKDKLRHGKKKHEPEIKKPSKGKHQVTRASAAGISAQAHRAVSKYEDDNVGVEATHSSLEAAETAGYVADHAVYAHKLKGYDKAEKMVTQSDRANVEALHKKYQHDHPDAASNPISRWRQRQAIKKEYAAAKSGKSTAQAGSAASKGAKKAASGAKNLGEKVTEFFVSNKQPMLLIAAVGMIFILISGMFSSCTAMFQGGTEIILGSSFTAKDEDILGANDDYKCLEAELRTKISCIETTHSGYDEYRYNLVEIGHNPYELTAYLTVLFEDYSRAEVQSTLQSLFREQYTLRLEPETEIRTRTETRTGHRTVTDADGNQHTESYTYEVEVDYEYHILNVTLINHGLGFVIGNAGLSEDQMERYRLLLETKGNRPDLFGDDIYVGTGEYTDYDIPGEALTDIRFANMIREAEKYLGYPYVWGGSSPSTSFDCSGFVSWVINHCGNGWNVGRLGAQGLMNYCDIIPKSAAKPGDLIFFQGTYDTTGASHVGIYVGNGMMIHCGDPISYTTIESNYWRQHFYCFGRIPD